MQYMHALYFKAGVMNPDFKIPMQYIGIAIIMRGLIFMHTAHNHSEAVNLRISTAKSNLIKIIRNKI